MIMCRVSDRVRGRLLGPSSQLLDYYGLGPEGSTPATGDSSAFRAVGSRSQCFTRVRTQLVWAAPENLAILIC